MTYSKKLTRQFSKAFDEEDPGVVIAALKAHLEAAPAPDQAKILAFLNGFPDFCEAVEYSYEQYEEKNRMAVRNLELSSAELNDANRNLEKLNRAINTMLDSLGQGLFFFDSTGVCSPIFSTACLTLVEKDPSGKHVADVLGVPENERGTIDSWLRLAFSNNTAMDFSALTELIPNTYLHSEGLYITLVYRPMYDADGKLMSVLVVATDKTAEREAQQHLQQREERALRTLRVAKNRNFFVRFVKQTRELLAEWDQQMADAQELLKYVHTLKGVAMTFQLTSLGHAFHTLETGVLQNRPADRLLLIKQEIEEALEEAVGQAAEVLGNGFEKQGNIRQVELARLAGLYDVIKAQLPGESAKIIALITDAIVAQPVWDAFKDLDTQLLELAERYGKKLGPIEFTGENFLLLQEPYEAFLESLVHLGRNIINHGIEDPKMREEFGKDPVGKVTISTERMEVEGTPFWQLIIADDGAGIDTDALRSKLRRTLGEAAVDAMDDEAIMQQIFEDNVSTSATVNELAGRGVGMSAIRQEVVRLGGSIVTASVPCEGARFIIRLPVITSL